MIDTIKLTLDRTMINMLHKDRFEKGMANPARGYFTLVQNPIKNELTRGIYKPRLTLTNRFNCSGKSGETLSIELSLPKLIFGNNFDELTDQDFPAVTHRLQSILKEMGVFIYEGNLLNAPVSSIHYSKNIILTDYTTPHTYIKQLTKLNINKRLDTNQTDYRNEGHSFKYRANSFEVAFYDKVKDLQMAKVSEKRSEEKDNALQLDILDTISQKKPLEVLRIEIRLNRRQKIRQILKNIDKPVEPIFANLFNQDIAQKVLLHYLNEIEQAYPPLFAYEYNTPKKFFEDILISNPTLKPTQALELMGFRTLLNEIGVREYRQIIKNHGDYYWYSLNKKMKALKQGKDVNVFSMLKDRINKFEPIRQLAYHGKMINNDKYDN